MPSTIQQSALALRPRPAIDRPAFDDAPPGRAWPYAPLRGPRWSVWQCVASAERGQGQRHARQRLRHARLGAWRMSGLFACRLGVSGFGVARAVGLADASLAHRVQNPIALGGATALGG
jgi:hypothetical protein